MDGYILNEFIDDLTFAIENNPDRRVAELIMDKVEQLKLQLDQVIHHTHEEAYEEGFNRGQESNY